MLKNHTALIQHRHTTKLFSLIFGYCLWFWIAQYQTVSQTYQANIYFYDTQNKEITAPNFVHVTLQGSRKDMYHFNPQHLAIHLDGSTYDQHAQEIQLTKENLFLPDTIKLVDLTPSYISIHVNPTEKQ